MPELTASLSQKIEREASLLRPTRLTPGTVNWGDGPSPDKFWIPEHLVPLYGLPEYEALSPAQRLRYNQYSALHKTESFIWFERHMIIAPLRKILSNLDGSPALRLLLESFVADEEGHSASLRRLLEISRPDLYTGHTWCLLKPSFPFRFVTSLMVALPRLLSSWSLLMGAIEENTITTSQAYRQAGESVDRLFAEVYMLHAQDEARHCKLDAVIAEWLVETQTGWKRSVNGKMLELAFRTYFDPTWGFRTSIYRLIADFPELQGRRTALVQAAETARAPSSAHILIDGELAPITARNAERFDMLGAAIRRLL